MDEILHEYNDDNIVCALVGNIVACLAAWATIPSVTVADDGNVITMASGVPETSMNFAVARQPVTGCDEAYVTKTARFFAARALPHHWWDMPTSRSAALDATLRAHGYTPSGVDPGMVLDLQDIGEIAPDPVDLTVMPAADEPSMRQWAEVSHRGFAMSGTTLEPYYQFVRYFPSIPGTQLFLGLEDGVPVTSVMLAYAAGVAGIYWVATVPEARRHGYGNATVLHALRQARAAGYRYAVLEASAMGQPIYARMGFVECCQVGIYVSGA